MKKRKKMTQQRTLCTLLLCGALTCLASACGSKPDSSDLSEANHAPSSMDETDSVQQPQDTGSEEESKEENGQMTDSHTVGADEQAQDNNAAETDTTVSPFTSHIRVEMKQETEEKKAEDGTVYYTTSYTYPIIHIAEIVNGNDDAIAKINADIRSRVDSFLADTEIEEWAKEEYAYSLSEESEYPFFGYSHDMTFCVKRADNKVISFAITFQSYTGGAHGNYGTQGVNYNAKTGEIIAFSELSDDAGAFHEDTLAYHQALAKTEAYQMRMFPEDMLEDNSLESVLYADDAWYLSTSGLTFFSDPYALGPFASGTIEFTIPYDVLSGMGFNENYTYADRFTRKLLSDTTNYFDLNGDGMEDSILFSTEVVAEKDDAYRTLLHLTINDTDFTTQCSETLSEHLSGYSWGELSAFDLNVDDNNTELVILSGESEGEDYIYYSYFFRYTRDGSLLYLGKVKGDVLDPSMTFSALE